MKKIIPFITFLFVLQSNFLFATTWDEPWHETVVKKSDVFLYGKVLSSDEEKGFSIEVIRSLAGKKVKSKLEVSSFYSLELCSSSKGHGPEFHFTVGENYYFFLKAGKKGTYEIATPTSGFAYTENDTVFATYRHSYHMALVPMEVYEKTMLAIFNNYHNLDYDKVYITNYITKYISQKPAGFDESEIHTFFGQHVALECIYHLKLTDFYNYIPSFLADTSNFHNQVSAARALISYHSTDCQEKLMEVIKDTSRSTFVQTLCVQSLAESKPKEFKQQLEELSKNASTEHISFGGNIMDPRICSSLPNVKEALEELIKNL